MRIPSPRRRVRGPRFHENPLRHLSEGERFTTSEGRVRGRQETNITSAALQLAVIVFDVAAAPEIPQRGVSQFAVLLLAAGLEIAFVYLDVLADRKSTRLN